MIDLLTAAVRASIDSGDVVSVSVRGWDAHAAAATALWHFDDHGDGFATLLPNFVTVSVFGSHNGDLWQLHVT